MYLLSLSLLRTSTKSAVDQPGGLETTAFVKAAIQQMPGLRPLMLFLKYFLYCRSLHDTYTGGIGSFLLQIMAISFLQLHPRSSLCLSVSSFLPLLPFCSFLFFLFFFF